MRKQVAESRQNRSTSVSQVRKPSVRGRAAQSRDAQKLRVLRSLYFVVYNDDQSLVPQAVELFHAVGDILEGVAPEELDLHRVNRSDFLCELSHAD